MEKFSLLSHSCTLDKSRGLLCEDWGSLVSVWGTNVKDAPRLGMTVKDISKVVEGHREVK